MKLQPVSADLVIKLALGLALVGAVVYLAKRVGGAAGAAVDGVTAAAGEAFDYAANVAYSVSPLNHENVIYQTANTITGGSPDTSLGSRIYDWVNPDPVPAQKPATPAKPASVDWVTEDHNTYPTW